MIVDGDEVDKESCAIDKEQQEEGRESSIYRIHTLDTKIPLLLA